MDGREDRAWLLRNRVNPFPISGVLSLADQVITFGLDGVAADADIVVAFNRPVVPLTAVEQQGNAPQPLTFEPAIEASSAALRERMHGGRRSR